MTTHVKVNGKVVMEDEGDVVTLVLSKEAATALQYVCGMIGGGVESTQRKYTTAIYRGLSDIGIDDSDYNEVLYGMITFIK